MTKRFPPGLPPERHNLPPSEWGGYMRWRSQMRTKIELMKVQADQDKWEAKELKRQARALQKRADRLQLKIDALGGGEQTSETK